MNLYEMLRKCDKDQVCAHAASKHEDPDKTGYEIVFDKLLKLQKTKNDGMDIVIEYVTIDKLNDAYIDVSGYKNNEFYGIEFDKWEDHINRNVIVKDNAKKLLDNDYNKYVGEILYEITFFGFDENEIQKSFKMINDRKDEEISSCNDCKNCSCGESK